MSPKDLPLTGHPLLKGDTGTGKSFLFKTLGTITGLPTLIEDITRHSETGFVGDDVSCILSRALQLAGGNIEIAQACSLIVLDEIDKISSPRVGNAMVSRDGVARSLLKLIEGTVTDVPLDPNDQSYRSKRVRFDTSGLMWIGIGAFSGLHEIEGKTGSLGFAGDGLEVRESSSKPFISYGFMAELLGRFTGGIVEFQALSRDEMMGILTRNTLPMYQKECAINNLELFVDDEVLELMVNEALLRKTGARGLSATLDGHLSSAFFQAYSISGAKSIELVVSNGQVVGVVKMPGKAVEVPEELNENEMYLVPA